MSRLLAAPPPGDRSRSFRGRVAGVLLLGLVLGWLPQHNGFEVDGALDGSTRVFLSLAHGDHGACVGVAHAVAVPACAACVLQLQSIAAGVPVPQRIAGFHWFGDAPTAAARLVDLASPRLASSRGPPRT